MDAKSPQTILAGVVNDKNYGGVFVSHDEGVTWSQQSNGLQGRDVFDLSQSAEGVILAGTNAGIFRLDGTNWQPIGKIVKNETKTAYVVKKGKRTKTEKTVTVPGGQIEARVSDVKLPGAPGMQRRRTEFTGAPIRVPPGKAARSWKNGVSCRCLLRTAGCCLAENRPGEV